MPRQCQASDSSDSLESESLFIRPIHRRSCFLRTNGATTLRARHLQYAQQKLCKDEDRIGTGDVESIFAAIKSCGCERPIGFVFRRAKHAARLPSLLYAETRKHASATTSPENRYCPISHRQEGTLGVTPK